MKTAVRNRHSRTAVFGSIRVLAMAAVLVAMSIVCGKYLAIRGGDILRFSFENLPILLAGMLFGPVIGAVCGIAADLIGCFLVGYAINPMITLGAAVIGFSAGLLYRIGFKWSHGLRVLAAVGISHLIGSVGIKTFGLAAFYDLPFGVLLLWRLLNYAIIGTMEYLLLYGILKNKAIRSLSAKR